MSGDLETSSLDTSSFDIFDLKLKDLKIEKFGLEDAVLWEGLKVIWLEKVINSTLYLVNRTS